VVRANREKLDVLAARLLAVEVVEEEEITRAWGPKATRPGSIEGRGHTEAPPENPNRPVAVSEGRSTWTVPHAATDVADGSEDS
jgi:cell division protease FtsH